MADITDEQRRKTVANALATKLWNEQITRQIALSELAAASRRSQETKPVYAGHLLVLTDGSYSDYCLRGVVRALADFDLVKEKQNGPSVTISHLVAKGLAEELDHEEINLDDWGNGAAR